MTARPRDDRPGELFVRERDQWYNPDPVTCLGMTFESEDARREYFLNLLRDKLPELRKRPDFPHGEDEDILRMSDPPYYTACPNPFLADFVAYHGRPYHPDDEYRREPYAVDVSVGKTDKLYRAHPVPHEGAPLWPSCRRSCTTPKPGDIVLDGFCGSGMTGVAAQWCGTAPESYRKELAGSDGNRRGGTRRSGGRGGWYWATCRRRRLSSPRTTTSPSTWTDFAEAARQLLDDVEERGGVDVRDDAHRWEDESGGSTIRYGARSSCVRECGGEVVFLESRRWTRETGRVCVDKFQCPTAAVCRRDEREDLDLLLETLLGSNLLTPNGFEESAARYPLFINYAIDGVTKPKSFTKQVPTKTDIRIATTESKRLAWPAEDLPVDRMLHGLPDDTEALGG